MKRRYLLVFALTFFLLTGCTDSDSRMPEQEYKNPYTLKSLLVLSKLSKFKGELVENITRRLGSSYSIKIDDLDKIDKYNFAAYTRVLLIESNHAGRYEKTENYLRSYGGVNNMVFLGTVGEWETTPNLKVDAITSASVSNNVKSKANVLITKIRNY
jgi:hypothetical protein